MAKLAIKGHETRGKEVIEILEMLGGKNHDRHNGSLEWTYSIDMGRYACYYYIDGDGNIECSHNVGIPLPGIHFTLEEFLEKYPYKVGDKVYNIVQNENQTITKLTWQEDEVIYQTNNNEYVYVNYLQPYKEAPMYLNGKANNLSEEIKKTIEPVKEIMEEMKLDIPDGYEFFGIDDDGKIVLTKKQPRYPKTYGECCKIITAKYDTHYFYTKKDKEEYPNEVKLLDCLDNLRKLLICRDAYWKIAGEEMGLGKPWEPPYGCEPVEIFCVHTYQNRITRVSDNSSYHHILAFPTVEMRDAFYENFKDLIEECKEFL